MRAGTAVGATVILILVAEVWACAAGAQDSIKPGKWEISRVAVGLMQPPPGMQLGPGVRVGPQGMIFSVTECIGPTNPPFPPKAPLGKEDPCKIDQSDVTGDTVRWLITCDTPKGTRSEEGLVHYHGVTLDGIVTTRVVTPSGFAPLVFSQPITGRYLGPCDPK